MVQYREGHKNSKGESAPWVIVSCGDGKTEKGTVLSSHKSKSEANAHLQQMHAHSANESVDFKAWLGEQPQTPMMEAVTQIYDALFETGNWFRERFDLISGGTSPDELLLGDGSRKAYETALNTHIWDIGQNVAHDIGTKSSDEVENDVRNSPDMYAIIREWMENRDCKAVETMLGYALA